MAILLAWPKLIVSSDRPKVGIFCNRVDDSVIVHRPQRVLFSSRGAHSSRDPFLTEPEDEKYSLLSYAPIVKHDKVV